MATQTISVPDIGTDDSVEIIEINVSVGDSIELEQAIVVLESDKASMDIPSPDSGVVKKIIASVGDQVKQGSPLIELDSEADTPAVDESSDNQSSAGSTSSEQEFVVPVPEGAGGAEVIELCVNSGDDIAEGDSLIVLETDKASMEVPSPTSGRVLSISIAKGDTTEEGMAILTLAVAGEKETQSTKAESSASESDTQEQLVVVPDGAEDAEVIEICVNTGDTVNEGDSLIVLETDKASMEVPSPVAGTVKSIAIKSGDKTTKGGEILILSTTGTATSSASSQTVSGQPSSAPSQAPAQPSSSEPSPQSSSEDEASIVEASRSKDVYAGPAVRKLAREMAIDLTRVTGTGERKRITSDDVKTFVKQVMTGKTQVGSSSESVQGSGIPAIPAVDFSQFGEIELLKMSKIKKLTAANMTRNWLNIPHVTQFDDVDISELESFRKSLKPEAEKRGVKITPLPFLIKACAAALVAEPSFNVSMHSDGEHIVQKHYVNIGIAVDSPIGLVVPVLRDVDKKGIWEIASDFDELIKKAREGKLGAKDMQGGCFTISSLGAMGGTGFTPIVNAPEVAILGVSKALMKPVWNGSEFVPKQMLPLSLSYDHRAINGGDAGRFFTYLNQVISDIRRLLL